MNDLYIYSVLKIEIMRSLYTEETISALINIR